MAGSKKKKSAASVGGGEGNTRPGIEESFGEEENDELVEIGAEETKEEIDIGNLQTSLEVQKAVKELLKMKGKD